MNSHPICSHSTKKMTSECLDCRMQNWELSHSRNREEKIEKSFLSRSTSIRFATNDAYNPFSDEPKAMIREMGNAELFELCEPIPKVQYSECLLYCNQEILYYTCGHLLVETNPAKIFIKATRCFLNPAHRHQDDLVVLGTAKTEAQKEHFVPHNARKRCTKKNSVGIHDRFLKDSTYRDSQLKNWLDWKDVHLRWTKLMQENHSYCPLPEEFERYRKKWVYHTE